MSSEIYTFVKCIVCIFSGLVTPKLQTSGLTHKGRPFFTAYQTHFLRLYRNLQLNPIYIYTKFWTVSEQVYQYRLARQ